MRTHREVAVHLNRTGLPVAYLAPTIFMESLLEAADTIRDQGTIFAPAAQARIAFVAVSDVAKVAAHVSAVFARQVDYQDMPEHITRQQMLASGLSPWQTDGTIELYDWIRQGGAKAVTSSVRDLTGQQARPIDDWLGEMRAQFLSPAAERRPPPF